MDKLVRKIEAPLAKKAIEKAGLYMVISICLIR
jgi:hypothetical protein